MRRPRSRPAHEPVPTPAGTSFWRSRSNDRPWSRRGSSPSADWSVDGSIGEISGDGRFQASSAVDFVTGSVQAKVGELNATARVRTAPALPIEEDFDDMPVGKVPPGWIGVDGNTELAEAAGLAIGQRGGIAVNEFLQTSDPDVYAVGDCIEVTHRITGKQVLVPLGDLANLQGRVAGHGRVVAQAAGVADQIGVVQANERIEGAPASDRVSLLVCPPYPYLASVAAQLQGSTVELGAQNVSEHEAGAYTGEVAPAMLADVGCRYAIVGHSERRTLYGESSADVAAKFEAALAAGALNVMVSYSSWQGTKLHAHHYLVTDVLKGELGFRGFVVSDYLAINQLDADYEQCVVMAINAGVDMVMVPFDYKQFIDTLVGAVEKGLIAPERIDDAVRRILAVKLAMGLFDQPFGDESLLADVGSAAHRAVAREAVRKSLVLLKHEAGTLPLAKDTPALFVAGAGADDLGMQCGGWTIEWMGEHGPITDGTTILDAIRQAYPGRPVEVTFAQDPADAVLRGD